MQNFNKQNPIFTGGDI